MKTRTRKILRSRRTGYVKLTVHHMFLAFTRLHIFSQILITRKTNLFFLCSFLASWTRKYSRSRDPNSCGIATRENTRWKDDATLWGWRLLKRAQEKHSPFLPTQGVIAAVSTNMQTSKAESKWIMRRRAAAEEDTNHRGTKSFLANRG